MASHRITTETAQKLADDRRRDRYALPPARPIDPPGGEYTRVHPVLIAANIAAASGTTPASGSATLYRFNPNSGLLEALRSVTVYSVAAQQINGGSWQLAHQDPYGRFWLSSASSGGGGDGGGGTTPRPAFLVSAVIDSVTSGGGTGGGTTTVYGANSDSPTAAIKGTGQTVLSPDPFSVYTAQTSVANPYGLNGIDGDPCLLGYNESTDSYFLQEVYPAKGAFWFQLSANRPNGLGQSLSVQRKHGVGPGNWNLTVLDAGNVAINAKSGDYGYAVWSEGHAAYVALFCQHTATECTAQITADFDEDSATCQVGSLVGLDGPLASAAFTEAQNRFKRFGKTGMKCLLKWDTTAGEWFLLQVECEEQITPAV